MAPDDPIRVEAEELRSKRDPSDDPWEHIEDLPFFKEYYFDAQQKFSRRWSETISLSEMSDVVCPQPARVRDAKSKTLKVWMLNKVPAGYTDTISSKNYPPRSDAEKIWNCFKLALAKNLEFRYAMVDTTSAKYTLSLPQAKIVYTVLPTIVDSRRKVRDFRAIVKDPVAIYVALSR